MPPITRFAPSPTGYLHIGSARTALFNWLFARHNGGKFLLRIEDTDRERSTQEAIDALIQGLKWMGLNWDEDIIFQFARAPRHAEIAEELVATGKASYCYTTAEELAEMRAQAESEKRAFRYDGKWRDKDPSDAPKDRKPAIRLKAPQTGETTIHDKVQGLVTVQNAQLDDMVLLRSDGTPTYMLAVVVDDHDMNITHVIRGDDHFTNSFRQKQIYDAMGWSLPEFCHIPLIHGSDGAKLSKRHGALGVHAYEAMGFLPEAMRNYLLRLGWSHGDDEIISTEQAIDWFTLETLGKSPSRFDLAKLTNVNGHYIRESSGERLVDLITPHLCARTHRKEEEGEIIEGEMEDKDCKGNGEGGAFHAHLSPEIHSRLLRGMPGLKARAKTLLELSEQAMIYVEAPKNLTDKAAAMLETHKELLAALAQELPLISDWSHDNLEAACRTLAEKLSVKLGDIAGVLRAALTGSHIAPSTFEIMSVLGREEVMKRVARKENHFN